MGKSLCFIVLSVLLLACQKNPVDSDNSNSTSEQRILFVRAFQTGLSQLCSINEGSDIKVIYETERSLTPEHVNWGIINAIWAPNKKTLLIEGGESPSREVFPIWMIDGITGKILYQLTPDGGSAVWLPDGNHILFARRGNFGSIINDLYQINRDGTHETVLFHKDSLSIWPWGISPDGTKLIVGTIRYYIDHSSELVSHHQTGIFDIQSHQIQYLFHDSVDIKWAQWTSQQDEIYYIYGSDSERYDIYLFNLEDSMLVNMTASVDLGDFHYVALSPDNRKIAFTKKSAEEQDIYILDIATQTVTNITQTRSDSISYTVMEWNRN